MKRVTNPQFVPQANPPAHNQPGFYYIQKETGMLFEANTMPQLIERVANHRRSNGLPIGSFFEYEIEDWFCQQMPDKCVDRDGKPPTLMEKLSNFAATMTEWVKQGLPVCSKEELHARLEICQGNPLNNVPRCQHYRGDRGLGLVSCGSCGCSGLAVYVRTKPCPAGKWPQL